MSAFINPDQLEQIFDNRTLRRGRHYFQGGHVRDLSIDGEGSELLRINAKVNGSRRSPYQCEVLIEAAQNRIRSGCSCPMGTFCKHVAATLLEAHYQANSNTPQSDTLAADLVVQEWFQQLHHYQRSNATTSPSRLLYVLQKRQYPLHTQVEVYKANRRKNGTFGALQPTNQWSRIDLDEHRPQYVMHDDIGPVTWLRALNNFSLAPVVRGLTGHQFINAALQTGRLFWQSALQPLAWGEPIEGRVGWQHHGTHAITPEIQDLPEGAAIIETEPPLVVDPVKALVRVLEIPVSPRELELILQAPPMTPQQLERNLPDIERLATQWRAPLPPGIHAPQIINQTPVPTLYLAEEQPDGQFMDEPLALIRIAFQYGDSEIFWDQTDNPVRTEDGASNPVLVHRHWESEKAWLDQLPAFDRLSFDESDSTLTLFERRDWFDFLAWTLPELAASGWNIIVDETVDIPVVEPDDWYGQTSTTTDSGWFDLELGITQGDQNINLVPLLLEGLAHIRENTDIDDQGRLQLPEHLWLHDEQSLIRVPSERIKPMLTLLFELFRERNSATPEGRLRLSRVDAARILGESEIAWQNSEQLRALGRELASFTALDTIEVPEGFNATLRDYQQQGIDWLQFLRRNHLGAILADDMGLGKTIQTLAHIWIEKTAGRLIAPALVVCPTSLLPNWRREAEQFAPGLRVMTLHGPRRHQYLEQLSDADLVLTSYPLITRDHEHLKANPWSITVFDEAQNLKNPRTGVSRAARTINTGEIIALTGTPMENHLGELWSLFDLIQPGYLGDQQQFRHGFRNPIEKHGDNEQRHALIRRIRPFLLRRTKDQVTPELPEKTEIVRSVALKGAQRDLYETIRASMDSKVRDLLAKKGAAQSQIEILEALLKLRQACCDPRLIHGHDGKSPHSAKLDYLLSMVEELLGEGRRLLIFSQFTSMLSLIEDALTAKGHDYVILTGDTKDRATPVERFQNGETPIFLASLKAGGVGLNLMTADCVIHYDPWWNPAVEAQATDRAWRIGQDKPVFVYRLICEGTVEQRMQSLQQRKAQLADSVYGSSTTFSSALTAEDIKALFQPIGT